MPAPQSSSLFRLPFALGIALDVIALAFAVYHGSVVVGAFALSVVVVSVVTAYVGFAFF